MDHHQYVKQKRNEIVATATAMINGTIDLIGGCRKLVTLRYEAEVQDDDLFDPIIAIESDTDHLPVEEQRLQCSADYLVKVDKEKEEYLKAAKVDIIRACGEIVNKYISYKSI